MRKAVASAFSLVALHFTGWAAARERHFQAGSAEPSNVALLGLAIVALATSLGYKK